MKKLSDRDLDIMLSHWREEQAPEEGRLAFRVWRRIALREAELPDGSAWGERLARTLARPAFAVAIVLSFVLGGLMLAEARVQKGEAVSSEALEVQYFRAIDPVSMATHRHRQ